MKKAFKRSIFVCIVLMLVSVLSVSVLASDETTKSTTSRILGANITLGTDLTMNYQAELDSVYEKVEMKFIMNGKSTTVAGIEQDGKYFFSYKQIAPQHMGDLITAELWLDGTKVDSKENYSIATYFENLLQKYPDNPSLQTLIADTLEYGAMSQIYQNYQTENLVNENIIGKTEYSDLISTDMELSEKNEDANFISAGVWFDSVNNLYFKFNTTDIENTKIKIYINGEEKSEYTEFYTSNDVYIIYSEPIHATDFDDVYKLELYINETLMQTLQYSVKSYIYSKQNSSDENMANLAKALWNYGLSAKNYKGEHLHEWVIDEAIEATCEHTGLTAGKHCAVCNQVLVKQEILSTSHIFEKNSCKWCHITSYDYFTFTKLDDGTYSIAAKDVNNMPATLVLPSDYYGVAVTKIADDAFENCKNLTGDLIIPEGITSIGISAFAVCDGFDGKLVLPNSLIKIGTCAFQQCSGFTGNLVLPKGLTHIGHDTFRECWGFTGDLVIPDSVITIGDGAFGGCYDFNGNLVLSNSLTSIGHGAFQECNDFTGDLVIPDSVTSIGNYAFSGCSGLTGDLVIPNGVTSIGRYAFYGCSGLTGNLAIPNGVTTIGESAFRQCSSFTGDLVIPNGVTSIERYAFSGCSGFTGDLVIPNGVTSIGNSAFECCSGLTGDLVIPDGVTTIGNWAFSGCSGFTGNLVIPNGVTSIGDFAFNHCEGFNGKLVLPNSLIKIGACAFQLCSGFTGNLVIPDSVTSIGNYAFSGCSGFTGDLVIPNGVTSIGRYAFDGCSGFTGDLVIPNGVTSIGSSAFECCSGLTGDLVIPDGVTTIGNWAFSGCSGFTGNLVIPDGVTSIGKFAFYECSSLTGNLVIPNSVVSIGDYAFMYCSSLIGDLVIPNSVTSIGVGTFYGCSGLTGNLVIPNGVTTIGESAFRQCSGLTGNLVIPNGVTSIGTRAFYECSGLTGNLVIPDGVTTIGEAVFYKCSGLTGNLVIPNGVTSIGRSAFSGCSGLTGNLVIPDSVTSIGRAAFQFCSGLTGNLVIPDGVTSIDEFAFSMCRKLSTVTFPNSVTDIGENAFQSCENLTSVVMHYSVKNIAYRAFANCDNLKTIYYVGTPSDWNNINIGSTNSYFTNAKRYYYSQYHPTDMCTNYWHYAGEVPTVYEHIEKVIPSVAPTCTQTGLSQGIYCSACDYIIQPQKILPVTSHQYYNGKCLECGKISFEGVFSYKLNSSGTSYSIVGIKSFSGANLIIPERYNGKPITGIAKSAFKGYECIETVYLPKNITSIGAYAFDGCVDLQHIYYEDSYDVWNTISFGTSWIDKESNYYVHYSVSDYGSYFDMDSLAFPKIYSTLDSDRVAVLPLNGSVEIKLYDVQNNRIISLDDGNFSMYTSVCEYNDTNHCITGKIESMSEDANYNINLFSISQVDSYNEKTLIESPIYIFVVDGSSSNMYFTDSELDYIQYCIDMFQPLRKVHSASDDFDTDINFIETTLWSMSMMDDAVKDFMKLDIDIKKEQLKGAFAEFIQDYVNEQINPNNTAEDVKCIINFIGFLVDDVGMTILDERDYAELAEIYTKLKTTGVEFGDFRALLEKAEDVVNNPKLEKIIQNSKVWKQFFAENGNQTFNDLKKIVTKTSVTFDSKAERFFTDNKLGSKISIATDLVSMGCMTIDFVLYVVNDYSNNIEVLNFIKNNLLQSGYSVNDEIVQIIDELITEYNNKFLTSLENLGVEFISLGIDKLLDICLGPVGLLYTIPNMIGEITMLFTPIDEKIELYSVYCFNNAIYQGCQPIKTLILQGSLTGDMNAVQQAVKLYFNYVLYINNLILEVTDNEGDKQALQSNINYIETYFRK